MIFYKSLPVTYTERLPHHFATAPRAAAAKRMGVVTQIADLDNTSKHRPYDENPNFVLTCEQKTENKRKKTLYFSAFVNSCLLVFVL